jgi:hypothetical protein
VLGIGPERVIIWQGWGDKVVNWGAKVPRQAGASHLINGYGLDQWIKDGNARVRSWREMGDFVSDFEAFVAYEVSRPHVFSSIQKKRSY